MTSRRLTVQEAAEVLGTSVDAVRMRVRRGSLESEKDPDGRVHVWVNDDSTETKPRLDGEPSALISAKDETISTLREQLQAERQAHAEARRLLAAALERIPAIEAPQEPPEDAETVEEAPEGAESHSAAEEARDELGAERARREMAETTLREGMDEERRRREEAERERDGLRRELFALRGREEVHEAAEEQQGRGESPSATADAQESSGALGGRGSGTARGSLWRRIFGR
jgi:excisionase family DNA binding protein